MAERRLGEPWSLRVALSSRHAPASPPAAPDFLQRWVIQGAVLKDFFYVALSRGARQNGVQVWAQGHLGGRHSGRRGRWSPEGDQTRCPRGVPTCGGDPKPGPGRGSTQAGLASPRLRAWRDPRFPQSPIPSPGSACGCLREAGGVDALIMGKSPGKPVTVRPPVVHPAPGRPALSPPPPFPHPKPLCWTPSKLHFF